MKEAKIYFGNRNYNRFVFDSRKQDDHTSDFLMSLVSEYDEIIFDYFLRIIALKSGKNSVVFSNIVSVEIYDEDDSDSATLNIYCVSKYNVPSKRKYTITVLKE